MALLTFLMADPLIRLFIQDEHAVTFGTDYLKIIAFFYPFIGLNFILNGIVLWLRGNVPGVGAKYPIILAPSLSVNLIFVLLLLVRMGLL